MDGTMYVHGGENLYALNTDGSIKWKRYERAVNASSIGGQPIVATDGTIYCAYNGVIYSYTPEGDLKWTSGAGGTPSCSNVTISNGGTLYYSAYAGGGSAGRTLYAFDQSGNKKWSQLVDDILEFYDPSMTLTGSIIVQKKLRPTIYGGLECFSSTGSKKWEYLYGPETYNNALGAASVNSNGQILATDGIGGLVCLDALGKFKWRAAALIDQELDGMPPAIAPDGTAYSAGYVLSSNSLFAISPTGTVLWKWTPPSYVSNPVITSDGVLYCLCGDANLYAIRPDGTEMWHIKVLDQTQVDLGHVSVAADGTIYVSEGGQLICLS
jgi:outer membrane protein assembly factor BamB